MITIESEGAATDEVAVENTRPYRVKSDNLDNHNFEKDETLGNFLRRLASQCDMNMHDYNESR